MVVFVLLGSHTCPSPTSKLNLFFVFHQMNPHILPLRPIKAEMATTSGSSSIAPSMSPDDLDGEHLSDSDEIAEMEKELEQKIAEAIAEDRAGGTPAAPAVPAALPAHPSHVAAPGAGSEQVGHPADQAQIIPTPHTMFFSAPGVPHQAAPVAAAHPSAVPPQAPPAAPTVVMGAPELL